MRVILDNCVNRRFVRLIRGHEVRHVLEHGWDGLSNGKLLDACESAGYDVLLTVDKNMQFQQNLEKRALCLLVLDVPKIDFATLVGVAMQVQNKLDAGVSPGTIVVLKEST